MYCRNCGSEIKSEAKFCPKCGFKQFVEEMEKPKQNKVKFSEMNEDELAQSIVDYFNGEISVFGVKTSNALLLLVISVLLMCFFSLMPFYTIKALGFEVSRKIYDYEMGMPCVGVALATLIWAFNKCHIRMIICGITQFLIAVSLFFECGNLAENIGQQGIGAYGVVLFSAMCGILTIIHYSIEKIKNKKKEELKKSEE